MGSVIVNLFYIFTVIIFCLNISPMQIFVHRLRTGSRQLNFIVAISFFEASARSYFFFTKFSVEGSRKYFANYRLY